MFNKIWNALEDDCGIDEMKFILHSISCVINIFEEDYFKDHNAKNAAIDAVCEILQQHKDSKDGQKDSKD